MLETAAHKVKPYHLAREACLYVRQSSLKQVETNTESAHRQYGLRRNAIALGWSEDRIRVIDDDQGKSGASSADRSGFRDLMARIAAGEVGIVLSLEISRLARNNHDWSQLLQVARIADTLILDEAGVHDPGDSSDKLLLDIKGTISEYELEGIKARLIGGQRSKAARGELRIPLPIGLDYDEDGKVALDGDQQIVAAIGLVFQAFRDKGSAMAAAKWFRAEGLRLPSRPRMGPARGELRWSLPDHSRLRRILKNPRYAGAFSYGRTTQRRQADGSLQACDAAPRAVAGLHPGPARGLHHLGGVLPQPGDPRSQRRGLRVAGKPPDGAERGGRAAAVADGLRPLRAAHVGALQQGPAGAQPAGAGVLPVPGVLRAPGRKAVPVHARRHDRHRAGAVRGRGGKSRQHRAGAGRAGAGADGVRAGRRPAGPAHPAAGIRGRSGAAALLRGRPG